MTDRNFGSRTMVYDLFRRESNQPQLNRALGEINIATPVSTSLFVALAVLLLAAISFFLILGKYTHRERVSGKLVASAGVLTVTVPTPGRVTRIMVKEGDSVEFNQPLVELDAETDTLVMGNTHAVISNRLRDQREALQADIQNIEAGALIQENELRNKLALLHAQSQEIKDELQMQRQQAVNKNEFVEKIQPLAKNGIISLVQFEAYKSAAVAQQLELKKLDRESLMIDTQINELSSNHDRLPFVTNSRINETRNKLAAIDASLAENEAARGSVLRSPKAGVVTNLIAKVGQTAASNAPVLSILPAGTFLEAQLLVPSRAIGFINIGNNVVLRYRAFPFQEFGQRFGRVAQVSRTSLNPAEVQSLSDQTSTDPIYRVMVTIDQSGMKLGNSSFPLLPGMALEADVLLETRSLFNWVFQPLLGMEKHFMGSNDQPLK